MSETPSEQYIRETFGKLTANDAYRRAPEGQPEFEQDFNRRVEEAAAAAKVEAEAAQSLLTEEERGEVEKARYNFYSQFSSFSNEK